MAGQNTRKVGSNEISVLEASVTPYHTCPSALDVDNTSVKNPTQSLSELSEPSPT